MKPNGDIEWELNKKEELFTTYSSKFDQKRFNKEVSQDLGVGKTCKVEMDENSSDKTTLKSENPHKYIGYNEYHIIDNVLPDNMANELLQWSINREEEFVFRTNFNRCSSLFYLSTHKHVAEKWKEIGIEMHKSISGKLKNPPPGLIEMQLTRSGNGDFFGVHTDPGCGTKGLLLNRKVTFVYYLLENKNFTGGDLVLHLEKDKKVNVKPIHNRLIVMYPFTLHEILKLSCGDKWSDGRFTFNGWFHDVPSRHTLDLYK